MWMYSIEGERRFYFYDSQDAADSSRKNNNINR